MGTDRVGKGANVVKRKGVTRLRKKEEKKYRRREAKNVLFI